jgi:hypothetical protein
LLGLLVLGLTSVVRGWECPGHLIMMQIALKELTADERAKVDRLLAGVKEHDSSFSTIEAGCFSEDMTAAGFPGLEDWKDYEMPYYDGVPPKAITKRLMDSRFAIVRSVSTCRTRRCTL